MKPVEGLLGMENSGCWNLKENTQSLFACADDSETSLQQSSCRCRRVEESLGGTLMNHHSDLGSVHSTRLFNPLSGGFKNKGCKDANLGMSSQEVLPYLPTDAVKRNWAHAFQLQQTRLIMLLNCELNWEIICSWFIYLCCQCNNWECCILNIRVSRWQVSPFTLVLWATIAMHVVAKSLIGLMQKPKSLWIYLAINTEKTLFSAFKKTFFRRSFSVL